jgi:hypothetical protein
MSISILASTIFIKTISFAAFGASSSISVVFDTIFISYFAKVLFAQGKSFKTSNATTVLIVSTVSDTTSLILTELVRVFTLNTSILMHDKTAWDDAAARLSSERSFTSDTVVLVIISASRRLMNAFLFFLTVEIAFHALYASSKFVHFITEFVLGYASTVGAEDEVRITLQAFTLLGDQAVGKFASVVKKSIPCFTFVASSEEIALTSIDFAALLVRVEEEWSSARGASSIYIVASNFQNNALSIIA